MFKSFKEKLAGFFKKDKEEEKQDVDKSLQKEVEKIDKGKKKEIKPTQKYQVAEHKFEPDLEQIKEKAEEKKQEEVIEVKEEIKYLAEQVEEELEKQEEKKQEGKGFFSKLTGKFTSIHLDQETFDEFFEKLEMLLIENNVALSVVDKIREDMEKDLLEAEIKKSDIEEEIQNSLKKSIENILIEPFDLIEKINEKKQEPFVILFFGINGSGKTTTIAKVADLLQKNKINSVFAAADTFRAASIEQIMKHGEKLGIKVIHQTYGADPAAVGFDAIQYAKAHGIKVVLIDTAGRMHTKSDLLREMEKIVRVTQPDLKIFVAESITGNDATEQAKSFDEAFKIDATILTKADVDEKGGTAISIGHVTGKPILFLGTGQEYKDLQKFEPKEILISLGLG